MANPSPQGQDSTPYWVDSLSLSSEPLLLGLAAIVGLTVGLVVIGFDALISLCKYCFQFLLQEWIAPLGSWTPLLIPVIGGVLVSGLLWIYPLQGTNIAEILQSAIGRGQRIPLWRIPLKLLASAVSLGAGSSLGPEGPSMEIGGILGSALGGKLKFSSERVSILVGAGAAAGLAAGFNAPIAGVFLALELILSGSFTTSTISVVVLAAVVGALVGQLGLGAQPAFMLPASTRLALVVNDYEFKTLVELPFYLGLGFLASGLSLVMGYSLQWSLRLFQGKTWLGQQPQGIKLALGGLLVGLLGLPLPLALGVGYETIETLLQNIPFPLPMLLFLLLGKVVMTAVSMGCGFVGNTLGPTLFMGAVLGTTYQTLLSQILPSTFFMAPPAAYALVGMGAVWAGSVRAPLTAILLLFEMTRDYRIILPLMAAVGVSVWVTSLLPAPAFFPSAKASTQEASDPTQHLSVAESMSAVGLQFLTTTPLLTVATDMVAARSYQALVVDPDGQLQGILTLQDLETTLSNQKNPEDLTVMEICSRRLVTVYPDDTLARAHQKMQARGLHQVPVVERQNPRVVIGILHAEDMDLTERLYWTQSFLPVRPPLSHAKENVAGAGPLSGENHPSDERTGG